MASDPYAAFQRYYVNLGHFIAGFSILEVSLFYVLCKVARIPVGMGRALFSGTRADALLTLIRRAHEARGLKIKPWLERALERAAIINSVRNDVVHLVVESDDKAEIKVTNRHRYMSDRAKTVPVSSDMIIAVTEDVETVLYALLLAQRTLNPEGKPRYRTLLEKAQKPWQYKLPSRASSRPKSQGRHRGRASPQPPSEG